MWVNQPVSIKNDAKVSHSKSLLVLQLGGGFHVVQNQYTSYHVNITQNVQTRTQSFVAHCLATKVFIGKLPASGWVWVIIE